MREWNPRKGRFERRTLTAPTVALLKDARDAVTVREVRRRNGIETLKGDITFDALQKAYLRQLQVQPVSKERRGNQGAARLPQRSRHRGSRKE